MLEAGIAVEAGGHGLLTFRRQDLIVVSPGVPLSTPELVQVRSLGLPIIGELELAARFLAGRSSGHHRLQRQRPPPPPCAARSSEAGGLEDAGRAAISACRSSSVVDQSTAGAWSVLEVSSFQLETDGELPSPKIAVILNITPDHLDRHGTFENYVGHEGKDLRQPDRAKTSWSSTRDDPVAQQAASRAKSQVFWFSRSKIVRRGAFVMNGDGDVFRASEQASSRYRCFPLAEIPLKGEHNVENVLAAVCAACVADIPAEVIARDGRVFPAPSSTGWSSWPPSTASTTTTIPRPPTSTPPRRRSRPFRAIFT